MQAASIGETLATYGGQFTKAVASGAGTITLKAAPGRLCRISITTAGTVAFSVFDNASGASGPVIFTSPAITNIGKVFDVQIPAQSVITLSNPVSGPGFTVSWS
jgi:hypothetical protein